MQIQWRRINSFLLLLVAANVFLNSCGGGSVSSRTLSSSSSSGTPLVYLSASALNFSSLVVNTSSSKSLNLTNTGTASLSLAEVQITGSFSQTNTCPTMLDANASCAINVTFAPTAVGAATGTLTVSDSAGSGTQQVSLSGSGIAAGQLSASPASLAFGSVVEGQTSSKTVAVSNNGTQNITISSASTSGTEFSVSGLSLPLVLAAGKSTSFTVSFDPSSSGSTTATIDLANNGSVPDVSVALSGTGTVPPTGSHEVILTWTGSSSQVTGYYTYRGNISGGPYAKLTSTPIDLTTYADQSVTGGTTYYYVVTAVDDTGLESAYSEQVEAVVPAS